MRGAEAGAALSRRRIAGSAAPLALEVVARFLRIPLFPGFSPLITETNVGLRLVYAVALAGTEVAFLGSGAWEPVVAVSAAAWIVPGRKRRFLPLTAVTALAWVALGAATRSLGVGSFGFETLVIAVLVRVAGSELLAGMLARILLAAVIHGSVALVGGAGHLLGRPLERLFPAAAALALATGCAEAEDTRFRAEIAAAPETIRIDAGGAMQRQACAGCHTGPEGPFWARRVR